MRLRSQILLATVLMAALPLVVVIRIIGTDVSKRFTQQNTAGVEDRMRTVLDDLEDRNRTLAGLLDALAETMAADNGLRLALAGQGESPRAFLADYAPRRMALMPVDFLLIQDGDGQIISAGHFRGAFGDVRPELPRLLANAPGGRALLPARTAEGDFLALVRSRPLPLGGRTLHLTAGFDMGSDLLARWSRQGDLELAVIWPGGAVASSAALQTMCRVEGYEQTTYLLQADGFIVRGEPLPAVHEGALRDAWLLVCHDQSGLQSFLAVLQTRIGVVLLIAVAASVLLAVLLAGRISRPLADLARRTADLDLDRLDADFSSHRRDEVGDLTRLLGQMTGRLREGVRRLRAAEQKATLGEVARQVNHDIRNGITPLRNSLRHLSEVAADQPGRLAEVYTQRRPHLEEGLGYLEELATHYARLSPTVDRKRCNLAEIVAASLKGVEAPGITAVNAVPANLPAIAADPISLRRIFDNLLRNARESLPPQGGTITCDGCIEEDETFGEPRILIGVSDTGAGIAPEDIDRIFQDFFTTRPEGTGLGLSNVRRLIGDLGGAIRVASRLGAGTTFTLSFPLPSGGDADP